MKKVLHIGINAPQYTNSGHKKGFEQLDYEYYFFDWQHARFENGDIAVVRRGMIDMAEKVRPDLIFLQIQTKNVIDAETARLLQAIAPTVNFTCDVREDIDWYIEVGQLISLTCFGSYEDVYKFRRKMSTLMPMVSKQGTGNCALVQSSCDMDIYHPLTVHEKDLDIVFIGNNYVGTNLDFPLAQERQDMIQFLYDTYGGKFRAYGLGQKIARMVQSDEENRIYNRAKIAISHNNFDRAGYTSDRMWKIMASGCFCISKYSTGFDDIFKNSGQWKTFSELKSCIDFWLRYEGDRDMCKGYIRENIIQHHTWRNRFEEILSILEKQKA